MAKRILITGAAGALGNALLGKLREDNWWIRALVLPGQPLLPLAHETHFGDLTQLETLQGLLVDIDVVFHMAGLILTKRSHLFASVNEMGTQNLIQLAQAYSLEHFVYISSTSVDYPEPTVYAQSKFAAERLVKKATTHWTIVRPTLLVGKGGGAEYQIFKKLSLWPICILPLSGKAQKRPIHVDDLAKGLCQLLEHRSQTIGKTYSLCGQETLSLAQMLQDIRQESKKPPMKVFTLPPMLFSLIAMGFDRLPMGRFSMRQALAGLIQDATPSFEQAQRDFFFQPQPLKGRWLH